MYLGNRGNNAQANQKKECSKLNKQHLPVLVKRSVAIAQKVREKTRVFSLPELNEVSLELKPQSESHVERKVEQSRLQEVRIRLAQGAFGILVLQANRLRVEDVEEVGNEAELHPLVNVIRIIDVKIEPDVGWGSSFRATTSNRHFTGVPIDGMGQQFADWHASLKMHRWSNSEATEFATEITELLFSELIAGEDINYMPAISIEWSNLELVSEQIEITGGEIKQRADTRIGLTVVISKMPFVVSTQARNAPVRKQLPIVRKALVYFYLQSFVNVDGVDESIWNTVSPGVASRLAILTIGFLTHG